MLSLSVNRSVFCRNIIISSLSHKLLSPKRLMKSVDSQAARIPAQIGSASEGISTVTEGKVKDPKLSPENADWDPFTQAGLRRELMPKHVAAILDGNRRWAKAHGQELDYSFMYQSYMVLADLCIKWGVPSLSCFIFTTENWKRSKEANDLLLRQFQSYLKQSLHMFLRKGIKVRVIGEKTRLWESLQEVIEEVEEETNGNRKLELSLAVSYGGKWDIVEAIRGISRKAMAGEIELKDIDEALMDQQLSTHSPDPDLMIRTGGDQRVSNFLLWQMSHTDFYFADVYGPDFKEPHFIEALRSFQSSHRLFGK